MFVAAHLLDHAAPVTVVVPIPVQEGIRDLNDGEHVLRDLLSSCDSNLDVVARMRGSMALAFTEDNGPAACTRRR